MDIVSLHMSCLSESTLKKINKKIIKKKKNGSWWRERGKKDTVAKIFGEGVPFHARWEGVPFHPRPNLECSGHRTEFTTTGFFFFFFNKK